MALFKKQSSPPALFLHLDGGAVSVASVCLVERPKVLLSERATLPLGERSSEQLDTRAATLLRDTVTAFMNKYVTTEHAKSRGPMEGVEVHLGPSFVEAETAGATTVFPEPRLITEALIGETAQKAIALLPKTDRTTLESHVVRVHVNGYATGRPVGKTGEILAVTVFRSTIREESKRRIIDSLQTAIPGQHPILRSFARDLMLLLGDHADTPYHLIIDVEEGSSHCVSLRGDTIAAHATIPLGSGSVLAKVAGSGSIEETRTLIRLAAKDACSTKACEDIRARLAAAEPELVKSFGDGFEALSATYGLPNTCLILAHPDLAPWLVQVFSRLDFAQFTVTTQPLDVSPLHDALRGRVLQEDSRVDTWLETAIAAAPLFTKTA